MSEYERFFRGRFSTVYRIAREALGDDDAAALAAQALCLEEFRALRDLEAAACGSSTSRLSVA